MNEETKDALEKSILKWERIVDGSGVDNGNIDCALCNLHMHSSCKYPTCHQCPVKVESNKTYCNGTPHENWKLHHHRSHKNEVHAKIHCDTCKDLAQKELDFLKSLRET